MNPVLSRRVVKIVGYMAVNDLIPGGSWVQFANRIERAEDFDHLSRLDKYAILEAEREVTENGKDQERSEG